MSKTEALDRKKDELRVLEAHFQDVLAQKQSVQLSINEIANALEELSKTDGEAYKIVSGIMIRAKKEKLVEELKKQKKVAEMRVSAIENQERAIEKNLTKIRNEIVSEQEKFSDKHAKRGDKEE